MEVRPGYRQTEVGVIPEDWESISASALVEPTAPICYGVVQVGQDTNGGVPIVAIKYVKEIASASLHRTAVALEQPYSRSRVKGGDVLISIKGTIGRVGIVPQGFVGNISRELARLRPRHKYSGEYIGQQLESHETQARISRVVVGTTRLEFSIATLRQFELPIPRSLFEQHAIAAALGDVDALLDGLTRLIAKKRDLKQAAMQQLLTGQTRLPGFHREWEVKHLGEHVTFLRNGVNSRAELTVDGPVKYLHYGDVHACTGASLAPDSLPSLPSKKATTLDRLRDGDLIFADASEDLIGVSKSVEMCRVGSTALVAGLHTIAARFDKNILADGFKAYLQFSSVFAGQLRRLAAGTKVYATNRAHIASIEMCLPAVDEQAAIASVLNDMNAQIDALEARRDKTRALKQAMMQELLTGRTRLV